MELADQIREAPLPGIMKKHLLAQLAAGVETNWHRAMRDEGALFFLRVTEQVSRAAAIVRMPPDELMESTDLCATDLAADRLDSAYAEVRAIVYLHNEGFTNLQCRKATREHPRADIKGTINGHEVIIEVACATENTSRIAEELNRYLEGRIRKKGRQAGSEAEASRARRAVVVILNAEPAVMFGYQPLYREQIEQARTRTGAPPDLHVAIVTGRWTSVARNDGSFVGPDDVVVPPWPGSENAAS